MIHTVDGNRVTLSFVSRVGNGLDSNGLEVNGKQ